MKRIGIIGCGSIGTAITKHASKNLRDKISDIYLWDTDREKRSNLAKDFGVKAAEDLDEAMRASDLVIEAASAAFVPDFLKEVISRGKDAILISIGGVLGAEELLKEAREKGVRVMLPTGAIAGIDAVKAAKVAGIESATLTTRKPPKSLKGAPYFEEKEINIDAISEETVVFEGSAREAMKHFPKNINVSAMLSLAGIGADKTMVKIVTSPEFTKNSHEVIVRGAAGTLRMLSENVPSPDNPKTSYMASLATIASLEGYLSSIRIGT